MYNLKNADIASAYNAGISANDRYGNNYEFNRWFIRPRNRAEYYMTHLAISRCLEKLKFTSCLEIGPGPGTWTKLVYRANPSARFTLVDISEAMREQFMLEMRSLPNVTYQIDDIMEYSETKKFDLIFSSRAIEYFDDKTAFFTKLKKLVNSHGRGVIVTKNPHHGVRKSKLPAHQGQIQMAEMKKMLEGNGFSDIHFYPAVIRIPILSRFNSSVAEWILKRWTSKDLNIHATNRVVESYIVTFSQL